MRNNTINIRTGGYFETTTIPLPGHAYANAYIYARGWPGEENAGLTSYSTQVFNVTPDRWLTVSGTYSATTRKHISWAIAALHLDTTFGVTYKVIKALAEKGEALNLRTGERRQITLYEFEWAERQREKAYRALSA